jgi:hypothetical protein
MLIRCQAYVLSHNQIRISIPAIVFIFYLFIFQIGTSMLQSEK